MTIAPAVYGNRFNRERNGNKMIPIETLAAFFILATVLVFGSVALLAGTIGQWLNRSDKTQLIMNRVAGTVFVGLALKLATIER